MPLLGEAIDSMRQSDIPQSEIPHDPGALSIGWEFPRTMYHAALLPRMVLSAREEAALGREWSREYIYQHYPRVKHHWNGKNVTVQNADQEKALGGGWADAPDAFDAFKGARRPRTDEQNPLKWLDAWSVPGLLSEHRKKIRAELLRADAAFERSNDSDPESAALPSMRQAFDGIARVLFEAGILTEDLLRKDVQQLVWDSAIAGGWWRRASETCQDIFPEPLGHYWVWRDDSRDWKGLFRAEAREWEARLLESPSREIPDAAIVSIETSSSGPADECGDFGSEAQRIAALAAYKKMWERCPEADLARAANVHPADLSKWKKNRLPASFGQKSAY